MSARPTRPAPLTEWRHWKGGRYMVLTLARHHARIGEWWVIYRGVDSLGETWARPLSEWEEPVEPPGQADARVARFTEEPR